MEQDHNKKDMASVWGMQGEQKQEKPCGGTCRLNKELPRGGEEQATLLPMMTAKMSAYQLGQGWATQISRWGLERRFVLAYDKCGVVEKSPKEGSAPLASNRQGRSEPRIACFGSKRVFHPHRLEIFDSQATRVC